MLAVERFGGTIGVCVCHEIAPPVITAGLHLDSGVCSIEDDHTFDRRRTIQRFVYGFFERNDGSAPSSSGAFGCWSPHLMKVRIAVGAV